MSLAPPDSYFVLKNKTKNIRSLHKITGIYFCTKIKISLLGSLLSKMKSEDQCINLVWPYSQNVKLAFC